MEAVSSSSPPRPQCGQPKYRLASSIFIEGQSYMTVQVRQHPRQIGGYYHVAMADDKSKTLSRRIKHILEVMEWTETDMAREIGAGHASTIQHWTTGRNKRMQSRFAWPLYDKYRWNPRWVLDGEGPERVPAPDPEKDKIIEEMRQLPLERLRAIKLVVTP